MKFIKKLYHNNRFFNIFIYFSIFLYTLAAVLVSLHRYWQFETFYYDFGIYDQALWLISRFKPPLIDELAPGGKLILADHFVPSMFVLSPLYWLTNRVEIILIAQAFWVGLSLIIAFLIAKKEIRNKILIFALILAYAGYIGLQNAIITDFHPDTIVVLPLMILFWAIFNKKWRLYWIFLFFVLGFKENLAGLGAAIGLYLYFKKDGNKKIGLMTTILSCLYFFLVIKVLIPFFNQKSYFYQPVIPKSIYMFFSSFFSPSIKLKTLLVSFSTFGFLPLLYPPLWPAYIEHFLERFVLNIAGTRWELGMHYNAVLSPLMFISSLAVIKKMEKIKKYKKLILPLSIVIIFIVIFYHRFLLHGPLGLAYHPVFYTNTKRQGFMHEFIGQIPEGGLLMTQNNIASKFTHQRVILLKDKKNYKKFNPDYVAVDLREGQNCNNFYGLIREETEELVAALLKDSDYKLSVNYAEHYIFEKIKR